ncbi:hypothetical protein D9M68_827230 [compost metagenome]
MALAAASCPLSVIQPAEQPPGFGGAPVSGTVKVTVPALENTPSACTGNTVCDQAAVVCSSPTVGAAMLSVPLPAALGPL